MPTLPPVIQWLLFAITFVTFVGAATVYLRGSRDKGTIETLQRNNEALTQRVGILEGDVALRKAADLVKDERIRVLETLANSGDKIDALSVAVVAKIDHHHDAAMGNMVQLHTDLTNLPAAIKAALGGST
jgi:hypothetical protein